MDVKEAALKLHEEHKGKISVVSKVPVKTREDLSLAYTPGVAEPCLVIKEHPDKIFSYTSKGNMVAVVTDGSAVLGLGNIGAKASLPVMEGKVVLFKEFAGIDAFPICIESQDPDTIVEITKNIAPAFGGINLEDIAAPKCFEVEDRLKAELDIPVMHDDQHGTAVVVLAGIINALKVSGKDKSAIRLVINGVGAAGVAVCKILSRFGINDIILVDSAGIIYESRAENMNPMKEKLSKHTNREKIKGSLADAVRGSDVFIGLSAPGVLTEAMVASMNRPIIFAMANPVPEIMPEDAISAGAAIVATGRSDFPNQINNALGFPGIFRGALDARARAITEEMKLAAAYALAGVVREPTANEIIPSPFNKEVVRAVSEAVKNAAE